MAIDERKIKILQAIINDYIITGEPVGSRTIAKRYDLGVGSATIRNEMADLEEMGYLEQPHTSSGRIPSNKGYRLYVDKLMNAESLSKEEELKIKEYIINSAMYEVDKIVKQACTLLSELTNLTCIVETPSVKRSYIKSIQLLMIDNHNLVSVIVADSGVIKNHRIRVREMPGRETLQRINEILNLRLRNLTIEEINLEVISNLKNELEGYDELFNAILPALYETLKEVKHSDILVEGATNIFNYPEYNDIEKAKEILSLINDKDCVIELLESPGDISIKIGEENYFPEAKECSVISAEYSLDGRPIGTIGLIGPRRINYSKVIAIMGQVMKELNRSLRNQSIE
ncbi:heat-inducible transcriptional repressor HrcA [Clostridium chauvoei]|uniref:Heat-inducible transcription repressor HrcA n=2 Tax=Clostridium chauvoei TaxID=46867 RepID=S6F8G0_9CLOT|nr:heat-inducible transcriptional repressor HrcA [Clostridium chauvoei]ATD54690.1 heat-inducible transcriptional repressor HrcA [Clostridium chauvoei]ATD57627.1 heat-inducible transcriptional repressor HrcA [Clostridium chauvoei]MBX7279988.1 heat-inducible transcriptional repressor HrcA [Clostridium chauvoei]MBX7282353.1 heat-inducible transcriptional repressor HrcA [Clostridium chauvoei]MBX7284879.1 heat-inducible transcriptional repressor HrcA [Clostridium chauvoei]